MASSEGDGLAEGARKICRRRQWLHAAKANGTTEGEVGLSGAFLPW
jgi:hypothetical protein